MVFAFFGLYLWNPYHDGLASEASMQGDVISLKVNNEPLGGVLEKISKATGYTIVLKTDFEDVPVNVELNSVTLHDAIRRILQEYNHIEIWDDSHKILDLYIWNTKGPPVSLSGKQRIFVPATKTIR